MIKKKLSSFLILSACLFSSSLWGQESETPSAEINLQGQLPKIEFSATSYSFGSLYQGQIVSHSFPFKNTGNGTLVLSALHSSCGCIAPKTFAADGITEKSVFKAGESGSILVTFDTSQFIGKAARTLTVETNMGGASSPTVSLSVLANVTSEISADPHLLYLGTVENGQDIHHVIHMYLNKKANANNEPLQITQVTSNAPYIHAKLENNLIDVHLGPEKMPIGPLQAFLTVTNNSTYQPKLNIPIIGEVKGHVDVSAKYVEFGVVNSHKPASRIIRFQSSDQNFAITGVKIILKQSAEINALNISEQDIFSIHKDTILQNNKTGYGGYSLIFSLNYPKKEKNKNSLNMNVSGNFLVKTNDPDYNEISIPFFGIITKDP